MTILDTAVFGIVAGLVTLKVFLLAAAAVLLLRVLTKRARHRSVKPMPARVRHTRLDEYA